MGNHESVASVAAGPIVDLMEKNHGMESLKCLGEWSTMFGFPEQGTFNKVKLDLLERNLLLHVGQLKSKRTDNNRDLENCEQHLRCLEMWQIEANRQNRKKTAFGMTSCNAETAEENMTDTDNTKQTLRRTFTTNDDDTTRFPFSLYSEVTEGAGPLLDIHPPYPLPPLMATPPTDQRATVDFRLWTERDMAEALVHLPNPVKCGERFHKAFATFCREFMPTTSEIRRLLMKHMGPMTYAKVSQHLVGDARMENPDWDDEVNKPYVRTIEHLLAVCEVAFPKMIDMNKITLCNQHEGEDVSDYQQRLYTVFRDNCGIDEPQPLGDARGMWETLFIQSFLRGIHAALRQEIQRSCVTLDIARLETVSKHAQHAQEIIKEQTDKDTLKEKKEEMETQLAIMNAVVKLAAAPPSFFPHPVLEQSPQNWQQGGRGRGRPRYPNRMGNNFRPPRPFDNDVCFICHQKGHWARECPLAGQPRLATQGYNRWDQHQRRGHQNPFHGRPNQRPQSGRVTQEENSE